MCSSDLVPEWDVLIEKLSPLAYNDEQLYLAAETAVDTYKDIRFTSDHMAVLGAVGILPMNQLIHAGYMKNTLHWIWDNWNWAKYVVVRSIGEFMKVVNEYLNNV